MKTIILLTDAVGTEQALERLPALRPLEAVGFSGRLQAGTSVTPYSLVFAQYAGAWGKKYYVWDGSDPQADFPEHLQSVDCLILSLSEGQIDFARADAALADLLTGLRESGEDCRLLLLCTPAPLTRTQAVLTVEPDPDFGPESVESVDSTADPGSDVPAEESDPASDPEAAESEPSDLPDAAPMGDSSESADSLDLPDGDLSGGTTLPFLFIDPQLSADGSDVLADMEDAPAVEMDTLCRMLFLDVNSEELETVFPTLPQREKKRSAGSFFADIFDWVEIACLALVGVILLMSFFIRRSPVEGSSMYPTLIGHNASTDNNLNPETGVQSGYDDLLISNLFYTPKRLDIVIIQEPTQPTEPIVKRIIGLSGDRIKMNFDTWEVYVNGVLLDEPYVNRKEYTLSHQLLPTDENNCWEGTVPEGCIFVLGDNRGVSKDSRTFGFIDQRYIIGKVVFRIGPLSRFGTVNSGD